MRVFILLIVLLGSYLDYRAEAQLIPTKLRVTVIDRLGNFVERATVSIYESEEDYRGSKNAISTLKTDKKGRVTFKSVKAISYFVEAKYEAQNNNGEGVMTSKLFEGRINKINTIIE